jgi:hypothetical protein
VLLPDEVENKESAVSVVKSVFDELIASSAAKFAAAAADGAGIVDQAFAVENIERSAGWAMSLCRSMSIVTAGL